MTVAAYLDYWLAAYAKSHVRDSAYTSYVSRIEQHLKPQLGHHTLKRLNRIHIQAALAAIARNRRGERGTGAETADPLMPATIRRIHQVLFQALKHAVEWGLLAVNPAARAKPGHATRPDAEVWDRWQLRAFLAFTEADDLWGPLWLVAISTGLRQGELLGLGWQQADRGRLHVTRTLSKVVTGTPVFQPPKSDRGRRVVPIDARVVVALHAWSRTQHKHRFKLGAAWRDHDLVFTVGHGGPLSGSNVTHRFQRLAKAAKLPVIRFHDLRHSHATLLVHEGVPVKIVSERLGHDSIAITADLYAHVLPDMQQMALEALEIGLFGESGTATGPHWDSTRR